MAYHVDIQTGITSYNAFSQALHDFLITTLGWTEDSYTDGTNWIAHYVRSDGRPIYVKSLPYNASLNEIHMGMALDVDGISLLNATGMNGYWSTSSFPANALFAADDSDPSAFVAGMLNAGYWNVVFCGFYTDYLGAKGFTTLSSAAVSTDTVLNVVDATIFTVDDWIQVVSINNADKSSTNLPAALVEITAVDTTLNTVTVGSAIGANFSSGSLVGMHPYGVGLTSSVTSWGNSSSEYFRIPFNIDGTRTSSTSQSLSLNLYPYYNASWFDTMTGTKPVANLLPCVAYSIQPGTLGTYGQLPGWLRTIHRAWPDQSVIDVTDISNPGVTETWKFFLCNGSGGIALRMT